MFKLKSHPFLLQTKVKGLSHWLLWLVLSIVPAGGMWVPSPPSAPLCHWAALAPMVYLAALCDPVLLLHSKVYFQRCRKTKLGCGRQQHLFHTSANRSLTLVMWFVWPRVFFSCNTLGFFQNSDKGGRAIQYCISQKQRKQKTENRTFQNSKVNAWKKKQTEKAKGTRTLFAVTSCLADLAAERFSTLGTERSVSDNADVLSPTSHDFTLLACAPKKPQSWMSLPLSPFSGPLGNFSAWQQPFWEGISRGTA